MSEEQLYQFPVIEYETTPDGEKWIVIRAKQHIDHTSAWLSSVSGNLLTLCSCQANPGYGQRGPRVETQH